MADPVLKHAAVILILLLSFYYYSGAQTFEQEDPLEILFIGSSYFNMNNMPDMFNELAISSDKNVHVESYMPSGLYLYDHANSVITEEKIRERNWDFVVLQGVGSLMAYPEYFTDYPEYSSIAKLRKKILFNCFTTRIIYCMPWAYEDGMTWAGWPDTYEDMQIKIYDRTLQYSDEIGFTIAPVGWVWYKVLDEKDYPLHYLHGSDWNHPTISGTYLMTCAIYSSIFVSCTENNPYITTLSESEANYFQEISDSIVLSDTVLWKITSYIDSTMTDTTHADIVRKFSDNSGTDLRNFPNPFSSATEITFKLNQNSFVELNIYNKQGILCSRLLSDYHTPGIYTIPFHAEGLPAGIYFCKIRTESFSYTRKMEVIR